MAENNTGWSDLPLPALRIIFEGCSGPSIASAACSCRSWRHAAADSSLWNRLYTLRFPGEAVPTDARAQFAARHTLATGLEASLHLYPRLRRRHEALEAAAGSSGPLWALAELQRMGAPSGCHPHRDEARASVLLWAQRAAVRLRAASCGPLGAQESAALILDGACLTSLLVDPSACDLRALRQSVAELGAAVAVRLREDGLEGASNGPRLQRLTQMLFSNPTGRAEEPPAEPSADPGGGIRSKFSYRFRGNASNYYDPANASLASLLATRHGLPITLAALHVTVAAAAGIEVLPIASPMHFMCGDPQDRSLLFDVFNGGAATTPEQLGQSLGLPPAHLRSTGALQPATPRLMTLRMLRNLANMVEQGSPAAMDFGPRLQAARRSALVGAIEALVGGYKGAEDWLAVWEDGGDAMEEEAGAQCTR